MTVGVVEEKQWILVLWLESVPVMYWLEEFLIPLSIVPVGGLSAGFPLGFLTRGLLFSFVVADTSLSFCFSTFFLSSGIECTSFLVVVADH